MDTKTLILEARARFKHQESKLYLTEKYQSQLTFASQGGMWTITPNLISFLRSSEESIVLIDNFNTPIKVDTKSLLSECEQIYRDVTETWLKEFENLQRIR